MTNKLPLQLYVKRLLLTMSWVGGTLHAEAAVSADVVAAIAPQLQVGLHLEPARGIVDRRGWQEQSSAVARQQSQRPMRDARGRKRHSSKLKCLARQGC